MKRTVSAFVLLFAAAILAVPGIAAPATTGIVQKPIVSLHKYPSFGSECVTQAFLGEPVQIVARKPGWLKVTLPDQYGYPGWIPATAVHLGTLPKTERRVEIRSAKAALHAQPDDASSKVLTAYFATSLPVPDGAQPTAEWIAVLLPGNKTVYVREKDVRLLEAATKTKPTGQAIIELARIYTGVPYVWGGMSTIGVDCSGFTHTVYRFSGIKIHRDADQQFAFDGVPVARKDLQAGDLVFFKTYLPDVVSHVGFYIGNGKFIHASSRKKGVGVNDLSEPYFSSRYAGARRILRL